MIDFVKMHGLGNDFVVVGVDTPIDSELVRVLCDRRFGIGADGVLRVSAPAGMVTMEYWNADGSAAEMCGNGLRCVARYAHDRKMTDSKEFIVDTPVGERKVRIEDASSVVVELGSVSRHGSVQAGGFLLERVSVGNPHAVTFVDNVGEIDVSAIGRRIGTDTALFPEGSNVEFVRIVGPSEIEMRVWERGVGETLACGSGIVAAAAAHPSRSESVTVHMPGGTAQAVVEDDSWFLRGPAEYSFSGTWER